MIVLFCEIPHMIGQVLTRKVDILENRWHLCEFTYQRIGYFDVALYESEYPTRFYSGQSLFQIHTSFPTKSPAKENLQKTFDVITLTNPLSPLTFPDGHHRVSQCPQVLLLVCGVLSSLFTRSTPDYTIAAWGTVVTMPITTVKLIYSIGRLTKAIDRKIVSTESSLATTHRSF